MTARKVKELMDRGYKPWGSVIPAPEEGAPKGSGIFQFRKGRHGAVVVLTKDGQFVRGFEFPHKGQTKEL